MRQAADLGLRDQRVGAGRFVEHQHGAQVEPVGACAQQFVERQAAALDHAGGQRLQHVGRRGHLDDAQLGLVEAAQRLGGVHQFVARPDIAGDAQQRLAPAAAGQADRRGHGCGRGCSSPAEHPPSCHPRADPACFETVRMRAFCRLFHRGFLPWPAHRAGCCCGRFSPDLRSRRRSVAAGSAPPARRRSPPARPAPARSRGCRRRPACRPRRPSTC